MSNSIIRYRLLGMAITTLLIPTALIAPSLASSDFTEIDAALNYPTAAERFFNEGQQQFEEDIQRLSEPSTDSAELLQVDESLSDTSEQQRLQLEQPDGRSPDREPSLSQ